MDKENKDLQFFNYLKDAVALDKLEKYQESIEILDKAIQLHPEIINVYILKVGNLIKLGKHQEAMGVVDKILKIEPNNSDAIICKEHIENIWIEGQTKGNVMGRISVEEFKEMAKAGNAVITNDIPELGIYRETTLKTQAKSTGFYLFFDTETTGLPRNWNASVSELSNWPRLVQIAWILCDKDGNYLEERSYIIKPESFRIPVDASSIHGITTEHAEREGVSLQAVLIEFQDFITQADFIVAHNISFDEKIVGAEFLRKNMPNSLVFKQRICTKEKSTNFCAIPSPNGFNDYKWPKLGELYYKLFGKIFNETHDALSDIRATSECFWELKRRGIL